MDNTFESKRHKWTPIVPATKPEAKTNNNDTWKQIDTIHKMMKQDGFFDTFEEDHHHKQSDYESQNVRWTIRIRTYVKRVKIWPFEFIVASDRTGVWRKDLLKFRPVCSLRYKSAKRLYSQVPNKRVGPNKGDYFE